MKAKCLALLFCLWTAGPARGGETRSAGGALAPVAVPALPATTAPAAPLPLGPVDAPLHPLIIGDIAEPGNPLLRRMDWHAQNLLGIAAPGQLQPNPGEYLAALARPGSPAIDRLAAGVMARVVTEPWAADLLLGVHPAPEASVLRFLPDLFSGPHPYRGGFAGRGTAIGDLSHAARTDPDVSLVFDGGGKGAGLELEDLGRSGDYIVHGGRRLTFLNSTASGYLYDHPTIPGAAVELLDRPQPVEAKLEAIDPAGERLAADLGRLGLGPRVFGADVVFGPRITSPKPMYKITVKERLYGNSLENLVRNERVTAADKALVRRLLESAARAGYAVSGLETADLLVGNTLADPARRAYVQDPARVKSAESGPAADWLAAEVTVWMQKLDESIRQWALINARARAGGGGRFR